MPRRRKRRHRRRHSQQHKRASTPTRTRCRRTRTGTDPSHVATHCVSWERTPTMPRKMIVSKNLQFLQNRRTNPQKNADVARVPKDFSKRHDGCASHGSGSCRPSHRKRVPPPGLPMSASTHAARRAAKTRETLNLPETSQDKPHDLISVPRNASSAGSEGGREGLMPAKTDTKACARSLRRANRSDEQTCSFFSPSRTRYSMSGRTRSLRLACVQRRPLQAQEVDGREIAGLTLLIDNFGQWCFHRHFATLSIADELSEPQDAT